MKNSTHILLAILLGSIYFDRFGQSNIWLKIAYSAALIIGVLLPDIDQPQSTISQKVPASQVISLFFRHRSFFHSVWPIIILYITFQFLISDYLKINNFMLMGLLVGYAAHLAGDALTVHGIYPAWPLKFKLAGPVKTGGVLELVIGFLTLVYFTTF